ncbi:hypothetical protein [Pelagibius sp. Alg239-R121]|uniref:hypothetical protein n=1 Tax=Pelagibius sp. Alg239-R121 TaxID=2993448 RepID=UPI0024A71905|nr:hypothetical protein [Pelagibius sp. Alg239-R121]
MKMGVKAAICFAVLMLTAPEVLAETITVEVEPGEVRKNGLPWDTGLGSIFLGNPKDILPDIKICAQDPDTGQQACAPVCRDARSCTARIPVPKGNKKLTLLVFDDDRTNKDEFILSALLDRWITCAPCTDGKGKAQSRYRVTGWSGNGCGIYDIRTRAPDVPQALTVVMNRLRTAGIPDVKGRFNDFSRRGGLIVTCLGITYPAAFVPDSDQIKLSANTLQTESEDVLLRILLEEIAHATTSVGLSDPAKKRLQDWAFEYQQKLLRFEAEGWIVALLARQAFLASGKARPPVFALNKPGKSTEKKVERIANDLSRGRISMADAISRMVPFVSASKTLYKGSGGTQVVSYADHYGQQGVKVWNCAKAGKAVKHSTGLWVCN